MCHWWPKMNISRNTNWSCFVEFFILDISESDAEIDPVDIILKMKCLHIKTHKDKDFKIVFVQSKSIKLTNALGQGSVLTCLVS